MKHIDMPMFGAMGAALALVGCGGQVEVLKEN